MTADRFNLEAHLIWRHAWPMEEIHDLSELECMELHDSEHAAGYPGHDHSDVS